MLLSKYVLSNTSLDDETEQIQVTRDKQNPRMPNTMTTLLNI